jgi:uncharacterized protein YodC (DUF2158 family)
LWCILGLVHGDDGSANGTWLAQAQYGMIAKSTDGGATWTKLAPLTLDRSFGGAATTTAVSDEELTKANIMATTQSVGANNVFPALKTGVYVGGTWYIAGDWGLFASSTDLTNWTIKRAAKNTGELFFSSNNGSPGSYFITSMIHADGILHAVGSTPNQYVAYDLNTNNNPNSVWALGDALSAVTQTFGTADAANIASGNGSMVIVGSGGRVMYKSVQKGSYEGRWLKGAAGTSGSVGGGDTWVTGLAYAGGIWVAGLRGGQIAYSDIRWGDD